MHSRRTRGPFGVSSPLAWLLYHPPRGGTIRVWVGVKSRVCKKGAASTPRPSFATHWQKQLKRVSGSSVQGSTHQAIDKTRRSWGDRKGNAVRGRTGCAKLYTPARWIRCVGNDGVSPLADRCCQSNENGQVQRCTRLCFQISADQLTYCFDPPGVRTLGSFAWRTLVSVEHNTTWIRTGHMLSVVVAMPVRPVFARNP